MEYGAGWLRAFVNRATGLSFEEAEAARVAAFVERKLVDLFNVAEKAALANGRSRIQRLRRRRGGPTRLDVERAAPVVDLSL